MKKKSADKKKKKEEPVVEEVVKELTPEDLGPEPWIADLAQRVVNDESWSCQVCLMVERQPCGGLVLSQLWEAFDAGRRWPVRDLSVARLWPRVKTGCSKSKKVSPFSVLCDEIKKSSGLHLDGPLPAPMLASLLKYELLRLKELDLQRKNDRESIEKMVQDRYDYYVPKPPEPPPPSASTGKKSDKSQSKKGASKSSKKSAAPVTPEVPVIELPTRKINTSLQKRGESSKKLQWYDDRPEKGPDLYVLVSSFYDPRLPREMVDLGLPLACVMELDCLTRDWKGSDELEALARVTKYRIHQSRRDEVTLAEEMTARRPLIDAFWRTVAADRIHPEYTDCYKDVIFAKCVPPLDAIDPGDLEGSATAFRERLYDDVANNLYETYATKILYGQYLSEVPLIPVTVSPPPDDTDRYEALLDLVPSRAATVPFILDCMLAQVCHWSGDDPGYSLEQYALKDRIGRPMRKSPSGMSVLSARIDRLRKVHDLPRARPQPPKIPPERTKVKVVFETEETDLVCYREYEGVRRLYSERVVELLTHFWDSQPWMKAVRAQAAAAAAAKEQQRPASLRDRMKQDSRTNSNFHDAGAFLRCLEGFDSMSEDAGSTHGYEKYLAMVSEEVISEDSTSCGESVQEKMDAKSVKKSERGAVGLGLSEKLNTAEELTPSATLSAIYRALEDYVNLSVVHSKCNGGTLLKFYDCTGESQHNVGLPSLVRLGDFFAHTMDRESRWVDAKIEIRKAEAEAAKAQLVTPDYDEVINDLRHPVVEPVRIGNAVYVSWEDFAPLETDLQEGEDFEFKRGLTLLSEKERLRREAEEARRAREENSRVPLSKVYDMGEAERLDITVSLADYCVGPQSKLSLSILRRHYHYALMNVGCCLGHDYLWFSAPVVNKTVGSVLSLVHGSGLRIAMEETDWPRSDYLDFKVSWPTGLLIETARDSKDTLYFRQKYIRGPPEDSDLSKELYRCILNDGTVLKFTDGEPIDIYLANGTIIEYLGVSRSQSGGDFGEGECEEEEEPSLRYHIVAPDGKVFSSVGGWIFPTGEIDVRDSQDITGNSVVTRRADGTVLVHRGGEEVTLSVDYPEGTRITTRAYFAAEEVYCEWEDWELEALDRMVAERLRMELGEGAEGWFDETNMSMFEYKRDITQNEKAEKMSPVPSPEMINPVVEKSDEKSETPPLMTYVPQDNYELRSIEFAMSMLKQEEEERRRTAEEEKRKEEEEREAKLAETLTAEQESEEVKKRLGPGSELFRPKPAPKRWELEGYLTVETSVTVEHTYYATVQFEIDRSKAKLDMPFDVSLEVGSGGLESVELECEASLRLDGGRAYFVRPQTGQRPPHEFMLDMNAYARADPKLFRNALLLRSVNHEGSVLELDTLGEVAADKERPENHESSQDLYGRYFLLREDYSSTEFSTEQRAMEYFRSKEKLKGTVLQKYDEEEFSEYLCMAPFEVVDKEWTVPRKELGLDEGLPSTYGDSWPFPIRRRREAAEIRVPEVLLVRHLSQLRAPDLDPALKGRPARAGGPKLSQILDNLGKDPDRAEDMYRLGSLYTKSPDKEFLDYMKTNVVEHAVRLTTAETQKSRTEDKFKEHKGAILNGKAPPYFETAEGLAFLIKEEITRDVMDGVTKVENARELDRLLTLPFEFMNDQLLERACLLMEERYGPKRSKNAWLKMMSAGRRLSYCLPDMKSVLKFNEKYGCHKRSRSKTSIR